MDFSNKVVIITGASSGIGAAAAQLFAAQSAKLVLVGRNAHNLAEVAAKCEQAKGIAPLTVRANLEDDAEVAGIVTATLAAFQRIDVLVNNAGVGREAGVLDGVAIFDEVMAVNLRSAYHLTSLAAPHIIKTKGSIVNVSSVAAIKPIRDLNFTPYCISKAAMDQFTKCAALEFGRFGVRVNSVNPGATRTQFAENAGFSKEAVEAMYKARDETYPLKKTARSDEVGDLILFLASDRAGSITGAIHVIDNGELLL